MKRIFTFLLMLVAVSGANARLRNNKAGIIRNSPTADVAASAPAKAKMPAADKSDPEKIIPTRMDSLLEYPITLIYKPKHKRVLNLQEIFVNAGVGYLSHQSNKAPMKNGITINTNYCAPLFNRRLLFELGNNADALFSPDKQWFATAYGLPQTVLHGLGMGFMDQFTIGLHAVVAGSSKVTLTVGPQFGVQLTTLPSVNYGSSTYFVSEPFMLCYGMKANLFVGKYLYCFAQYMNSPTRDLISNKSQSTPDASPVQRMMPVNFGAVTVGAGYVFKPWW